MKLRARFFIPMAFASLFFLTATLSPAYASASSVQSPLSKYDSKTGSFSDVEGSTVTLDQFQVSGTSFKATILSDTEDHALYTFTGQLHLASFDDNTTMYLADQADSADATLRRMTYSPESEVLTLAYSPRATGETHYARFAVEPEGTFDHDSIPLLPRSEAIKKYSFIEPASDSSSNATLSLSSDVTQTAIRGTFHGYKQFISALESGSPINPDGFSITKEYLFTPGWHHETRWGDTPFAVSVNCVTNGSDLYLFQIGFGDLRTASHFAGSRGTIDLVLAYGGGCVAEYDTSTGRCTIKYRDMGASFENVTLAIGNLNPQSCFVESLSSVVSGGTEKLALLKTVANPKDIIGNVIDLLSIEKTSVQTLSSAYGSRTQQLAKGTVVKSVGAKLTDGWLNKGKIGDEFHQMSLIGVVEYEPDSRSTWRWEVSYTATGDI